ncbi:MAG TPA: hypothetical protein VH720_12455, partial [Candidatus Limnocylindrales bacterium]
MAINVLKGRFRLPRPQPAATESLAIGEVDTEIFNCPVCQRPLAVGASRCPGCRTRLAMGRPLRQVAFYGGLGTAGVLAGALTLVTLVSVVQAMGARGASNDLRPSAAPSEPGTTSNPRPISPISANTRSALDQAVTVNRRLAASGGLLRSALARKDLDSFAVAGLLRDLAADATYGADLIARVRAWSDADAVATDLELLYRDVRASARGGLAASLTNDRAYRAAGQRMLTVLHRI